jgi:hypothetical protein
MDIADLAKMTLSMDTDQEEIKQELITAISDTSIRIMELIRKLQSKIDTLITEKPPLLLEELTEATSMLCLYLEMYSDDAFEVEDKDG